MAQALGGDSLLQRSPADLETLFRESEPGPIPVGRGRGTLVMLPGTRLARPVATLARWLFWQGKIFDVDGRGLRNLVSPLSVRTIRAAVYPSESWVDGRDCIVLDYSRTSRVARWIRDEIREVAPGTYLGVVFWGRRRILRFALTFASTPAGPGAGSAVEGDRRSRRGA